jgi:hypothetical protein
MIRKRVGEKAAVSFLSMASTMLTRGTSRHQQRMAAREWRICRGWSSRLASLSWTHHSMRMQFETMRGRGSREVPLHDVRGCDWPGCAAEGQYRAPRSRRELKRFWWFCLEHVRQYNAAWNYYAGMSEAEIEADVRFDTVWQRPSWRMSEKIRGFTLGSVGVGDTFDLFGRDGETRRRAATPEEKALIVLDLQPPVTIAIVKARYKQLVKLYHPDANGGDKASEERFKDISAAYRLVLKSLGE